MRFAIVNYGVGNLFSLRKALSREGVTSFLSDGKGLEGADAVALPGVGGFRAASSMLPRDALLDYRKSGRPIVGICLGMQLFFERSEEGPGLGLGFLPGKVRRLPTGVKVPQIGWNTIRMRRRSAVIEGLPAESWVYYVHSYYCETEGDSIIATSHYGLDIPSVIQSGNLVGVQFHPEKSGSAGATMLRNIVRLAH